MSSTKLLTVEEVRGELRVSEATIYNLFASGELPKVKIRGRTFVRTGDVEALIERNVGQPNSAQSSEGADGDGS
jgi:excisionase family DNA binding protein